MLLGRNGVLGKYFGGGISFTFWAAVLASMVVSMPLVIRSVRIAFEMADSKLEDAAGILGASKAKVFATITLPMAWPGIVGGFCLGFARAFGEFGATISFAGNIEGETRTLPLSIYTAMQRADGNSEAWFMVGLSMLVSLFAFLISELMVRKAAESSKV
jgi:molybdate transport system permease protein